MSKIILCCPFFNENLIANLNIEEASKNGLTRFM